MQNLAVAPGGAISRAEVPLRFGLFEADLQLMELRKQGRRIRLQTQPFQILGALLEHPGHVVTREELRRRLWPEDTFVDFDHSLNTAVRRLREALGDSPENPIFIETLQRRGYRFIAPVVESVLTPDPIGSFPVAEISTSNHERSTGSPEPWPSPASRPEVGTPLRTKVLFALGGVVAGAIVAMAALYPRPHTGNAAPGSRPEPVRSLAVLPLENLSADPAQEYLSDGMTDELIASLTRVHSLRIVPRTTSMAYKGTHKSLSEIARELNVDAVIEGTVMRSGRNIRITTELVEIATNRALWADTRESSIDKVSSLQQGVVAAIVTNLPVQLTQEERQRLNAYQPSDPEAYQDYLKGRYYWNKRSEEGLTEAIRYFEMATRRDPNYALAYAGLADCYGIIGAAIVGTIPASEVAPKAEAAARRALELDPSLAQAENALATVLLNYKWDWPGAEAGFRRALDLDPSYATAHQRYSLYLIAMGRTQESMAEIQEALRLDPLSVSMNFSEGWRLYMARNYDAAIRQLQATVEMDPSFALAHLVLGQALTQTGKYGAARAELEKAAQLSGNSAPALAAVACLDAVSGHAADAHAILDRLQKEGQNRYVSPFYMATIYSAMSNSDEAVAWLEKAMADRSNPLIFLRVDPEFDNLRSDARFQTLLHQLRL